MNPMILLALPLLLGSSFAHADHGERIDHRVDRLGKRHEARFDRRHP